MNKNKSLEIGIVTRSIPGETLCGDVCAWWEQDHRIYLSLADGLGHGKFANEAAQAAMASAQRQPASASLPDIIAQCDEDLRSTRGVAMGLAMVDSTAQAVSFYGVGNIRALLINSTQHRRFACGYGIVGAGFKNLFIDTQSLLPGDILIMARRGIPEHFVVSDAISEGFSSAQRLAEALLRLSKPIPSKR